MAFSLNQSKTHLLANWAHWLPSYARSRKPDLQRIACVRRSVWAQCVELLALFLLAVGFAQAQTLALGARTGATVKPLLGVNIGPGPQGEAGNVDVTTLYKQRGVNLVRTHDYYGPLDMATLYPDRGKDPLLQSSYNFTASLDTTYGRSSDSVFAAIVNGGFEPYFRIGDSYNNVAPPSSAQLANWSQAAVQVLKHYRLGQWSGYTSSFRFVEIGNEPDNAQFWPAPLTANNFNQLYDVTARAVRTAFPTLKIGGPGWAPTGCLTSIGQSKVRSLLDYVKANGTPMDFLSFHVYGSDAATYLSCAQFYRNELDTRGLTTVELHISEWNTSDGSPGSAAAQLRNNAQGAAYMTAAWINLQNGGVAQSTFYRGTDPAPNSPEFYGLFYGDGRAKKVADAFSLWRDFTAYGSVLALSGAAAGSTAIAAEDDKGARAVLIGNPTSTASSNAISFADGKALTDYAVSVSSVSDSGTTDPAFALTGSKLSVPANATVLLRLTPKANAFAATAQATGTTNAITLTLKATVAATDVGKQGAIYVLALAGTNWYAYNGFTWMLWTGGTVPESFAGNLAPTYSVTPLSGVDLRGLTGIPIFVGYGTSLTEMINNARYKEVYRTP